MRRRSAIGWPAGLAAGLCLWASAFAARQEAGVFMAFATWDQAFMGIGRFRPGKGWQDYQQFYEPSQPGDVFTLYTMAGEVARVKNTDTQMPGAGQTAVEWAAHISRWYHPGHGEPFALAIPGESPLPAEPARELSLEDPDLLARVAGYLKEKKLDVPRPFLTQAFEVHLSSGDARALLVCAHSDASALRDDQPANVYAVALLFVEKAGAWRTFPLASQTSYKPANRNIEDQERLNGKRHFFRFFSCLDIDGDGWKEIFLYTAEASYGTQIDVYTYDGRKLRHRISAFKHLYN